MNVEWRPVLRYEDKFCISNNGDIKNVKTGRVLSQNINKGGYAQVSVKPDGKYGKTICFKIHRLVAEAFLQSPSKELLDWAKSTVHGVVPVNHKDGNKANNNYLNLEWCTYSANAKHAFDFGLAETKKGVEHQDAKLSIDDVNFIRDNYGKEHYTKRYLAWMFKVSGTTIFEAAHSKSYSNI